MALLYQKTLENCFCCLQLTLAPFCGAVGQRAHYFQLDALGADSTLFTFVWKIAVCRLQKRLMSFGARVFLNSDLFPSRGQN